MKTVLPTPASTEQPDLAALEKWLDQIDNFHARFRNISAVVALIRKQRRRGR